MAEAQQVKPYLRRIKDWKIRNMVMLYLEARDQFKSYRKLIRRGVKHSFEKLREISDILYQIKEDHHLLFRRLTDPQKKKFEKTQKFTPDEIETEFMNNIGLLFHKMMAARELKYTMEHYVEESETFKKSKQDLQYHLHRIDSLFDEGIEILKSLIARNKGNILLLTLFLEDPAMTRRHFGQDAIELLEQFADGKGLEELYYSVAKFYAESGWKERAENLLSDVLRLNPNHESARQLLANVQKNT